MTEIEKIIKNGIVSQDFINEESRDDYIISSKIKKVWAIELDLLRKLLEVCQKHKIRAFAAFGTLLGAVRHKGFIPWDDDLDVWMLRDDYNTFLSLASKEFDSPYFVQTALNDSDYYCPFARLRNSYTTGYLVSGKNQCNNGIYIDIIPIDMTEKRLFVEKIKRGWINICNVMTNAYVYNVNPSLITRVANKVLHWKVLKYDPKFIFRYVDKLAQRNYVKSKKVGISIYRPYSFKKNVFDIDAFNETIYLPFENIVIPVPLGYDHILNVIYGDYMEFPPLASRGKWHNFVFEPDVPYYEYLHLDNSNK